MARKNFKYYCNMVIDSIENDSSIWISSTYFKKYKLDKDGKRIEFEGLTPLASGMIVNEDIGIYMIVSQDEGIIMIYDSNNNKKFKKNIRWIHGLYAYISQNWLNREPDYITKFYNSVGSLRQKALEMDAYVRLSEDVETKIAIKHADNAVDQAKKYIDILEKF